jgi:EAL and modified HD-GYP domain-containing signal transduction protein
MRSFFAGRQPIVDAERKLVAYELLFRDSDTSTRANLTSDAEREAVSANLLLSMIGGPGLESIASGKKLFVNCPRHMLIGDALHSLPTEAIVVEVLETVPADVQVLESLKLLRSMGFTIALDDWVEDPTREALLECCDIIKVEILADTDWNRMAEHVRRFLERGIRVLGEKIETSEQMQRCRDMGMTLFQGFFFAKPQVVKHKTVDSSPVAALELMSLLDSDQVTLTSIEERIERDPAISFRLLRLCGSALLSRGRRFSSIHQAVLHLGFERIRQLAALMSIASLPAADEHQIRVILTRARMSELVAVQIGADTKSAFMVGMLANLGELLGISQAEALAGIRLTDDVYAALLDEGESDLIRVKTIATAFDSPAAVLSVSDDSLAKWQETYLEAVAWANDLFASMGD